MLDPRNKSKERIVPPAPLPFVSRKALRRVKDWIAPATECRYCSGEVELVENSDIYGRSYGDWPYAYLCRPCNAYVGVHKDTDLPLGTLANEALRSARKMAKSQFFLVNKLMCRDRTFAYQWLADKMGISTKVCHFGMFEIDQCTAAYTILKAYKIGDV